MKNINNNTIIIKIINIVVSISKIIKGINKFPISILIEQNNLIL